MEGINQLASPHMGGAKERRVVFLGGAIEITVGGELSAGEEKERERLERC